MDQPRLFRVSPDAIALTMRWEYPDGWQLVATWSAVGQHGRSAVTERYDRLSAEELGDVVSAVVSAALNGVSG